MATLGSASMSQSNASVANPQEQLSNLFGYRAEWMKEQIFDLFTEPSYFPELKTSRPCIIQGGRGTGKTTVLRGLSYEGQFALSGRDRALVSKRPFYGMYYRANTNIVSAFQGPELTEAEWVPFFAHYFNLVLCDLILRFVEWYQITTGTSIDLSEFSYLQISTALHIEPPSNLRQLAEKLTLLRLDFEAFINNVADRDTPLLTMQGAPVTVLVDSLCQTNSLSNKTFFFLIDEYENFQPYQQQVVNTLIKHSGQNYTFKIGVRELGISRRNTLNTAEQLISPADYVLFDIAQKLPENQFKPFALKVCNDRLAKLQMPDVAVLPSVEQLLPGLSADAEAELLGVQEANAPILEALRTGGQLDIDPTKIEPLRLYYMAKWAEKENEALPNILHDFWLDRQKWDTRYDNYKYSVLSNIRRGKRGIRRYYCGWETFTLLASSNIRYLLELVEQSLLLHLNLGKNLDEPVSPETQTRAAQAIGKKNLSDLEGLDVSGAQLTKLVLGLGRVFGQMADDPLGHAPEVNEFRLSPTEEWSEDPQSPTQRVKKILESAIMHLALIRWPATKLGAESDTRDYEYAVHPIFSAFFAFSYRRKRRMTLSVADVLGLISSASVTIREILARNRRAEEALPEQLKIFEAYFRGDS